MQRLQRHATYGHLKQLVLRMIAEDVLAETATQATNMLTALRCGASPEQGKHPMHTCECLGAAYVHVRSVCSCVCVCVLSAVVCVQHMAKVHVMVHKAGVCGGVQDAV